EPNRADHETVPSADGRGPAEDTARSGEGNRPWVPRTASPAVPVERDHRSRAQRRAGAESDAGGVDAATRWEVHAGVVLQSAVAVAQTTGVGNDHDLIRRRSDVGMSAKHQEHGGAPPGPRRATAERRRRRRTLEDD